VRCVASQTVKAPPVFTVLQPSSDHCESCSSKNTHRPGGTRVDQSSDIGERALQGQVL
jgi:hypothetical protein